MNKQVFFLVLRGAAVGRRSLPGLVEEDVPGLGVLGDVRGESVELLDGLGVDFLPNTHNTAFRGGNGQRRVKDGSKVEGATHLDDVVVEQQPEAVTLHDGDVMSSVRTAEDTRGTRGQTPTCHFASFHCAACPAPLA